MKYIANSIIQDKSKLPYHKLINNCSKKDDIISSIPTIIVGYKYAKENIENFNILKKWYPEQNIFWTFGKTERRTEYNDDIIYFYEFCINLIENNKIYKYFDILSENFNDIKKIINLIKESKSVTIYNNRDKFLFIHVYNSDVILGISLDLCEYAGINKKKILFKIKSMNNIKMVNSILHFDKYIKKEIYKKEYLVPIFYEYFNS